nr:hypothetical protein [Chlamydiota bacterium]
MSSITPSSNNILDKRSFDSEIQEEENHQKTSEKQIAFH